MMISYQSQSKSNVNSNIEVFTKMKDEENVEANDDKNGKTW